jgi:predicted membrane channel-forming protein YqfA (hemolysin III family)
MRDDRLYNGYRINFNSYSQILKSLFQLHNETVNIWTHFGGAIIMVIIIFSVFCYEINFDNFDNKSFKFKDFLQKFNYE